MCRVYVVIIVFFFSSRRRHTRLQGDWSSDVCSSDLEEEQRQAGIADGQHLERVGGQQQANDTRDARNSRARVVELEDQAVDRSEERRVGKEGENGRAQ